MSVNSRFLISILFASGLGACTQTIETGLNGIGSQIRSMAYTEIRPPSNLAEVGSVVLVRRAEPFELQVVCRAHEVLGPDARDVSGSKTVSSSWSSKDGSKIGLTAAQVAQFNASLGGEYIRTGDYLISNTKLLELSDTDIERVVDNKSVSQECLRAIRSRQTAGSTLTMVQSSLVADVTYHLAFDASVDASAQIAALKKLAPSLNATATSASTGELKGDALTWGIRDDKHLLRRVAGGNVAGTEDAELPEAGPTSVLPAVQATVLPPEGAR